MKLNSKVEYKLYVRRYAPFRSFGGGFEGDGREFSTKLDATSRTVGVATFNPGSGVPMGKGSSSGSSWVGPWEVRKNFETTIGHRTGEVRVDVRNVFRAQHAVSFTLYTEGNMPLKDLIFHKTIADVLDRANHAVRPKSPNPQGTPDIDTFVDFKASVRGDKILFEGVVRGDGFPNVEIFVLDAKSQVVALLDYRTKSGITGPFHRLFGDHAGNRLAVFRREVDLKVDGSFGRNQFGQPTLVQES